MLGATMNLYSLLNVSPSADLEEIKANYRRLILKLHPDKTTKDEKGKDRKEGALDFDVVHRAWRVLSDERSRRQYDALLKQRDEVDPIVVLNSSEVKEGQSEEDSVKKWQCKCGGQFVVDVNDLDDIDEDHVEVIVDCDSCSLSMTVDVDVLLLSQNRSKTSKIHTDGR